GRSGWADLDVERGGKERAHTNVEGEIRYPQCVLDLSRFAVLDDGRSACLVTRAAVDSLELLDGGKLKPVDVPYTHLSGLRSDGRRIVAVGASPTEPSSLLQIDAETERWEVVRRSSELTIDDASLSTPEAATFGGAHGFYYAPKNSEFSGPDDELPPL